MTASELNLGADHEQSKRLVWHWYKMFLAQQERVHTLEKRNERLRECIEKEIKRCGTWHEGRKALEDEGVKE